MKKLKKLKFLLFLPLFLLSSCGNSTHFGTYSFKMGKPATPTTESTQIGVSVDLKNEKYTKKTSESVKDPYVLSMSLMLPKQIEDDTASSEQTFEEFLFSLIGDNASGYFAVKENAVMEYSAKGKELGKRIVVGVNFSLKETGLDIDIPSEFLEQFFACYLNSKQLVLSLPVSLVDLQMQLAWYGLVISPNISGVIVNLTNIPGKELPKAKKCDAEGNMVETSDRVGTHPTKDDVAKMNEIFKDEFKDSSDPEKVGFKFRDFNNLKLELIKE